MPARLFCKTGRLAGMECRIEREATIGSHSRNTISLPRGTVSRRHARIYYDARDNCYYLEDLRSRNGTLLDGSEVRRPQKLGPLHVITFVEHDFVFVNVPKTEKSVPKPARNVIEQEERPASGKPIFPKTVRGDVGGFAAPPPFARAKTPKTIAPVSSPAAEDDETHLRPPAGSHGEDVPAAKVVVQTPRFALKLHDRGENVQVLKEGENVIGRAPNCDIQVDDRSLSRRHATLALDSGKVILKDLGSMNGCFVSGVRVHKPTEVRPGTALKFGGVEAELIIKD